MKKTHVFTEFLFCLFPELSPWGHSTKTLQSSYLDLEGRGGEGRRVGGGEGGHSWERGLRLTGRGTRSLQQDLKQPQQPRRPPGPRDPTASWKEFPEGNRGSSSSLSRTGKPEKANGLVSCLGVTRLWPRLAPTEGRKLEPGAILCSGQV